MTSSRHECWGSLLEMVSARFATTSSIDFHFILLILLLQRFMYTSQWSRLLKNVGVWQGSFTQFSPEGKLLKDTPSELTLEKLNEEQILRLTLQRDHNKPPVINEFTHLNRNIFLFEEGHFAKGSQQFSPYTIFAAEYGFLVDDRRCRLVQLFEPQSNLESLTLIREYRKDSNAIERPMLSLEQLEGEWQGKAHTLYPDWRTTEPYQTYLTITREGQTLSQTLKTPDINLTSQGEIEGNTIVFNQGNQKIRLLFLPDGVSSTTPIQIKPREAFFVEFAWLVEPTKRYRLIRQYDNQGRWINVTLVTEYKQK